MKQSSVFCVMHPELMHVILLLCLWTLVGCAQTAETSEASCDSDVNRFLDLVDRKRDVLERTMLVEDLADYIYMDRECRGVSTSTIDRVTKLLDDEEDAVRGAAATALGNIGTNAKRALPALKRALARINSENEASTYPIRGRTSADVIPSIIDLLEGKIKPAR